MATGRCAITSPREPIQLRRDDPRAFSIQSETALGGLQDFYSVFVFERWGMRYWQDMRHGVTGLRDACEYGATWPVFCAKTGFGSAAHMSRKFQSPSTSFRHLTWR